MTRILAIDLGKFKSVSCLYDADSADATFQAVQTRPEALYELLLELKPDRVVIEVCGIAGWIHDLAADLGIPIQVANPQHEGWRWNKIKRKTDRGDALRRKKAARHAARPAVRYHRADGRRDVAVRAASRTSHGRPGPRPAGFGRSGGDECTWIS